MKPVIRAAARDDILRQFRYYLEEGAPEAASRFLEAIEKAIRQALNMPGIGRHKALSNPLLADLRCWPVPGFEEIGIYYMVRKETLRIIRVLHSKRDLKRILEKETQDEPRH